MKKQQLENQKGEIEFRKKLYLQQINNEKIFSNEFDSQGIEQILLDRMNHTLNQMLSLKSIDVAKAPFIEIGAERTQRTLVMENHLGFNSGGAAVDISYEMLKSGNFYKERFKKEKSSLKICCDANNLPFLSNSIPFVFCYETLHHFPEPTPIINEIHRVLSKGGHLYFDEEPFTQKLHFNLYNSNNIYSNEFINRSFLKKVIDKFFAKRVCNEVEHGIIENDDIPIKLWKNVLSIFEKSQVTLSPINKIQVDMCKPKSRILYFIAYLLGGNIRAICKKEGNYIEQNLKIDELLICPDCQQNNNEIKLTLVQDFYYCKNCNKKYPIIDNVAFLFNYKKMKELYPEIFDKMLQLR